MSRTTIYENCRAEGQSRAHFGDNYYNYSSTPEEDLIFAWLSPQDHSEKRNIALKLYQPDTLSWFFDDPTFKAWVDLNVDVDHAASARILWCRGDIGTGKSILASKIAQNLLEDPGFESHVALVYCSWTQRNEQTFETIFGSILAQLYLADIPRDVRDTYRCNCRNGRSFNPSRAQLESWLERLTGSVQRAPVIVLDGLDELQPAVQSDVLNFLQSSSSSRLKVLITSRFLPDEVEVREQVSLVHCSSTGSDIERFITSAFEKPTSGKVNALVTGGNSRPETDTMTKDQIVSGILTKSRGM
jgi:Cdc6-like AAA superfamily ATPase